MFCLSIALRVVTFIVIFLYVWSGMSVCAYVWVGCLHLSAWDETKHGSWSLSLMGINWVSDGVGINSTEYMCCKSVHFSGSLKQMTIIDFWERNRVIPMWTELLLLSNRLARLLVRQNYSELDFSVHAVVSTYTSVSVTKGLRIFMDQKTISMGLWKGRPNAAVM